MAPSAVSVICKKCDMDIKDVSAIAKCTECKKAFHMTCASNKKIGRTILKTWKCDVCAEDTALKSALTPLSISATSACSSDPNISLHSPLISHTITRPTRQLTNSLMSETTFKKELSNFKAHIAGMLEDKLLLFSNKQAETAAEKHAEIAAQNCAILEAITVMSTKYDEINQRMADIDNKFKDVKRLEDSNINLSKRVSFLEEKIDLIEFQKIAADVEIRGVPENPRENLSQYVSDIANTIDFKGDIKEIISIERKYNATAARGNPKSIIIKFATQSQRDNFLAATKAFNKKSRNNSEKLNSTHIKLLCEKLPIFVSEHLTQRAKYIYMIARKFAKEKHFAFCWFKNGKIFLKKQETAKTFQIKNESTLDTLS